MLTAIVTPLIGQLQAKVLKEIKTVRTELEATLDSKLESVSDKPLKAEVSDTDNGTESAAIKALQSKIASLEKENLERQQQAEKAELEAALRDAVASGNPEDATLALAGLTAFAGNLTKVEGKYITEAGKDLTTVAREFYESPSGKRTLPSGILPGTPAPVNGRVQDTNDGASLEQKLMSRIAMI
jgi:hypothetical protein